MDLESILSPKPVDTTGLLEMDAMPNPAATDAAESVRMLDQPNAVIPSNVMSERSRLIANWGLQKSADKMLAEEPTAETPAQLTSLATRYNADDPDDVEYGAYSILSEQDNDDIAPAVQTAEEWKNTKRTAGELRVMELGRYAQEATDAALVPRIDKNVAADTGDVALNIFNITGAQRLVNAIQPVLPGVEFTDRGNVGSVVNELQTRWVTMTNESEQGARQAMLEMQQVISNIKTQSDKTFQSDAQYHDLVDRLTYTLTDLVKDPNAPITNKMNTFMGWAEAMSLPVGGVWRATVKAGRTLNAVRLAPNKGAFLLAQTKTGAQRLWASVRNRELDGKHIPRGMKTEDVIGSLAIPRIGDQPIDNIPFLLTEFIPEADRAAAAADPVSIFGTHLAPRVTGTRLEGRLVDGGVEGTVHFGTTKGKGFSNQATADRWAKREFGTETPYTTVQIGNQWYIEATKVRQWGLSDINAKIDNPLRPGYSIMQMFGKSGRVSEELNETSSIAAREGDKALAAARSIIEPYTSLVPGSRRRVDEVLDKGDAERSIYTMDELRGRFGLNDREILGYASTRRLADVQRTLENIRLGVKADGQGFKNSLVVNGHGAVTLKVVDKANIDKTVKAIDTATGQPARLDNVPDTHEVVQFLHSLRTGERYGIVAKRDLSKLAERPFELIPNYPGYLPRPYKYPWYVKQFDENGVATTLRPARSLNEANELAADLAKSNPGSNIQPVRAIETRGAVNELDEFEALNEANLMYSNTRGPSRLTDISGKTRMYTVEDRIRSLMADVSYSVGLGRWAIAQEKLWNNTYGHLLGAKFSLGMDTAALKATAKGEALVAEASNYADFIQETAGLGRWSKGLLSNSLRNKVADWFYNRGLATLGDNISGLTHSITATMKTAAYVSYLSTNPLRQLPLQMTMIPSYMGVKGATRYIGLGKYFQDVAMVLGEYLAPGSMKSKATRELIEQWERSGVVESIDNHIFTIQTFGDGVSGGGGRTAQLTDALGSTHRMLKNVGINAGIYMDKLSAWLIARNRWQVMNKGKTIDAMAERQISAWANDLNLNPDKSDILPFIQSGAMSVFTQFMGQQIKVLGRLLQAATPGGGGPWTRTEQMRMASVQLLTWGLSGFGFAGFARKLFSGPEFAGMPAPVIQIVQDGFVNWGINTFINAHEEGTNKTDLAITDSFSPVNHVGGTLKAFTGLAELVTTGDAQLLIESNWRAPALGLGASGYQIAKMSYLVAGLPDSEMAGPDEWQKMQAIGMEAAKKFPVTNNTIQMLAAIEYGKKFNARGNPQAEATMKEAIAAVWGVKLREEMEARRLQLFAFPASMTAEKEERDVKQWAQENSKYLFPIWEQMADNKINPREAFTLANEVNMFAYTALPEEYRVVYINELQRLWGSRGKDKLRSMVDVVLKELGSQEMPATANTIDVINSLDISAEQKHLLSERIRAVTAGHNPKE